MLMAAVVATMAAAGQAVAWQPAPRQQSGSTALPVAVFGSDDRVPTSQGWEFYQALKRVGVPTDLLILPRQPHGPREPRLQRATQQWHLDWINRYCLGKAPAKR